MGGNNVIMSQDINGYINGNGHSKHEGIRKYNDNRRKLKLNLLRET